jgi:3-oxoacyl-[acyl-carrier protein] reductase
MNIDLTNKVVVVTGAGRGIGRVVAETFAREGAVTFATDVQDELLGDVAQTWSANGWKGGAEKCDVLDLAGAQAMVQRIVADHGRLDVLVNNAGVATSGAFLEDTTEEQWDRNHDINLKGTFLMCKAVIPQMKQQKSGRILNAASFAAIVPSIGSGAYASSKAGVHFFTRALAGELGPYNITVNCYAPGMIPTAINDFADAPPERKTRLLDTLTLRRWGTPGEVANLLCFLASDLAGYITGTLIDVSGGKLATQIPRAAYERAAKAGDFTFDE